MNLLEQLSIPFISLTRLFYPKLCAGCEKNLPSPDSCLCTHCDYFITNTNYHLMPQNPVLERFWGRVNLEHASTSYAFSKGSRLQNLIHKLKYEGQPEIGIEVGKKFGSLLKNTAPYNTVTAIVPVPLHPKKEKIRGYNQAAMFAQGLAEGMHKPWTEDYLIRVENTTTQTQKSRMDRFDNVVNAFAVAQTEQLVNQHILLVDDVITTGATLEACAHKLLAVEGVKVSLAAIALASS